MSAQFNEKQNSWGLGRWFWTGLVLILLAVVADVIVVTGIKPDDESGVSTNQIPSEIGIDQKLNAQVPLDVQLRDEQGNTIRLGDLMNGKPMILTPVYFECPMLCNMTMDGQLRSMTELKLNAGEDFSALTVSFDPREGPKLASAAKKTALQRYGREGSRKGWRFLTGDQSEVNKLMDAVGFHYKFDEKTGQYAHAAGLIVLTPNGLVSRYLYGVEFPARDLRLALVEASNGKVGTTSDQILLLCYHYDPTTGKYGLAIMNLLRLAGFLTVVAIVGGIGWLLLRERRSQRNHTKRGDGHNATKLMT